MSEDEIKDLIQTELEESGYMYTLGMLNGMYKAGVYQESRATRLRENKKRLRVRATRIRKHRKLLYHAERSANG